MHALTQQLKQKMALLCFGSLLLTQQVLAETDFASQQRLLEARVLNNEKKGDHSAHLKPVEKALEFHGVFYGYLPCKDCDGIKATLALKQNNNYLLVTQPAKESSREYYEKGKYTWNEDTRIVVLTARKDASTRQYRIEDEGTLIQLNSDGSQIADGRADRYMLRRSDTVKSREVHIH
ncbi:copper resistance protein NlpE [Methylovulum psychrotolerans]|uniref:Copper homeostasis protein n=1 Tax=Methylovulum psychrotolerans TaxID=1704499 RepID=A0A1Z4BXX2_9GAMM|nr:copper resistance protein NlpE [Methylovulum psychrotolerans]ASF46112.1 copper homeostasis protein [Methylovulum psychrotolerans]MBT9096651.1 copper resistance protein NlpE N-terminal domain-containing protein [Methylovulum psychrotolerans]POZ51857.1 copper resistance protein NlpE [Methylovulum psychrotolerans]